MTPITGAAVDSGLYSILFGNYRPEGVDDTEPPGFFRDLHLDQVMTALVGGNDPYRLSPLFCSPLSDPALITLRQDVFDDLDDADLRGVQTAFSDGFSEIVRRLDVAHRHVHENTQRDRWHLNAAEQYCRLVGQLSAELKRLSPRSLALQEIAALVHTLAGSESFRELHDEALSLQARLRSVEYAVLLRGDRITVGTYDGEPNYERDVVETFARFRQTQRAPHRNRPDESRLTQRQNSLDTDSVRERIVSLVAKLSPDLFAELAAFHQRHAHFFDQTVGLFHRELQFYLSYSTLADRLRGHGLSMTRARLRDQPGLLAQDVFDLSLALRLEDSADPPVCNDVDLDAEERLLVVTGPNQGGKTTFCRALGQLHYLVSLGCPAPGRSLEVAPADRILTHFEREELAHGSSKLEDDLIRMGAILDAATDRSVVVLNEILSSTTSADALDLASEVLHRLGRRHALVLCVTFIDELSRLDSHTVSMVGQVDPGDASRRTFRVERTAADGRAYAMALASRHQLTYDAVKERVTA